MCFALHPLALHSALVTVRFAATYGQLVLLREFGAVLYRNDLVLGLILATWLAWVATGAWALGRRFPLHDLRSLPRLWRSVPGLDCRLWLQPPSFPPN